VFPEYIFGQNNTYWVKNINKLGLDNQNGSLDEYARICNKELNQSQVCLYGMGSIRDIIPATIASRIGFLCHTGNSFRRQYGHNLFG
jgi:hypothetical protein